MFWQKQSSIITRQTAIQGSKINWFNHSFDGKNVWTKEIDDISSYCFEHTFDDVLKAAVPLCFAK